MPVWLTILLGVLGGTGLVALIVKDIYSWVKNSTKKARERIKQQKQDEMREVIQQELAPTEERVKKIEENTEKSLGADVVVLRCQMKSIRDKCKKEGYADTGDKATMKELYEKYKNLGGNHFKEYVNQWLEEVETLPNEQKENNE